MSERLRERLSGFVFGAVAGLMLLACGHSPAQPPDPVKGKDVAAPAVEGGKVKLVPRNIMRAGPGTSQFRLPSGVRSLLDAPKLDVPKTFDWSVDRQGKPIDLPLLGNNQYGDCFYVAPCHAVQAWTANATGTRTSFTTQQVVGRYLQLSPRDQGLYDEIVLPEFKAGVVGPNGPHKIYDYALVSPSDPDAVRLALWAFGPAMWTCSLCDTWQQNIAPNADWDVGRADPNAGHAMLLLSDDGTRYKSATWGFTVNVTHRGVQVAQSEIISCFSPEWFNKDGYAPNGQHYTVLAPLWTQLTGHQLPASPYPPPKPVDPPAPPLPVPPAPAPKPPTPADDLTQIKQSLADIKTTLDQIKAKLFGTPQAMQAAPKSAEPTDEERYQGLLRLVRSTGGHRFWVGYPAGTHYVPDFPHGFRGIPDGHYDAFLADGVPYMRRVAEPTPLPQFRATPVYSVPAFGFGQPRSTCGPNGCGVPATGFQFR